VTDTHQLTWNANLLHEVRAAFLRAEAAKSHGRGVLREETQRQLRVAVESARDAGIEWGKIADAIGTRRGNAYQRYRRRPHPAVDG
jgi:hypothetical protein